MAARHFYLFEFYLSCVCIQNKAKILIVFVVSLAQHLNTHIHIFNLRCKSVSAFLCSHCKWRQRIEFAGKIASLHQTKRAALAMHWPADLVRLAHFRTNDWVSASGATQCDASRASIDVNLYVNVIVIIFRADFRLHRVCTTKMLLTENVHNGSTHKRATNSETLPFLFLLHE